MQAGTAFPLPPAHPMGRRTLRSDLPTEFPDITGRHAWAWEWGHHVRALPRALDAWVVHAPFAHPIWHSYALVLSRLAAAGAEPAAEPLAPHFTHELLTVALSPDHPLRRDYAPRHLDPVNSVVQFAASSDARARLVATDLIREVCDNAVSPEIDQQAQWSRVLRRLAALRGTHVLHGAGHTRVA